MEKPCVTRAFAKLKIVACSFCETENRKEVIQPHIEIE